jgi:multidrug resistance protein, MATE family
VQRYRNVSIRRSQQRHVNSHRSSQGTSQEQGTTKILLKQEQEQLIGETALEVRDDMMETSTDCISQLLPDKTIPISTLVYLYRGLFIQLMFVLPVGVWWFVGVKSILLHLGQGEELSAMTEIYLRILAPGLWASSISWTFTSWLQAIEMADVPAYAAGVSAILHIPFNVLFIHVFGWGYMGVGVATVMAQTIQPIYTITYLFVTEQGRGRVLENTMAATMGRTRLSFWKEATVAVYSLAGILQYLSLAIPGIVIISEWWASEVAIFLAGTLTPHPDLALGAMTIYQSINTACFMLPVGCGIAGSTRVGNFLGAGDTRGADVAAKVSVSSAALLSTCLGCILYFTPHTIFPSFFTPDQALVTEASRLIPLLSVYVVGDGIQTVLNGIIKGCGRQCVIMPIVVVAYWIVGVPLAYFYAFIQHDGIMCDDNIHCGVTGLVSGMTIGTWTHMLLLAGVVVFTTNWTTEARKAKERMEADDETKNIILSEIEVTCVPMSVE